MATKAAVTMDDLLAQESTVKQLVAGETVSGTVLSLKKHEVLIDLGPLGVGTLVHLALVTYHVVKLAFHVS